MPRKQTCQMMRLERGKMNPQQYRCGADAVTWREDWRFGTPGAEPSIVKFRVPLCAECAVQWDSAMAEARAEASAS